MTSIGNDIVDLTSPDSIGKSRDRRFIARVFTPEEQEGIERSPTPDTTLWMFWAAKEAAFKAASKLKPGLSFIHRAFVVTQPRSADSRQVATSRPTANCPRVLTEEESLCSLAHHESARWDETGKAAPILLQQTNGDTMAIQERGMVITPAGPADVFFTLSPGRVHCVAAMKNGHGGAPAATAVQVQEERRYGPFEPSAAVRRAAIHHLATVLKASPYYIDIRRDKTPHGYGVPRVFIEGSRTDIDISLSHDGRYIAFAVHF